MSNWYTMAIWHFLVSSRPLGTFDPPAAGVTIPRNFTNESMCLKTPVFLTALLMTVPIGLYFTTQSRIVFERAFGMSHRDHHFYAAIFLCGCSVHVVMALFVSEEFMFNADNWENVY
uniref:Uncharacterized protein n=1 Tax=Equus asinus asinus TaxID=83772 RepID=A0A8C4LEX1_EQUAS